MALFRTRRSPRTRAERSRGRRHGKQLPIRPVALVLTSVLCGAVHDLATTAVRGSLAFLFTPCFFLLGVGVVLGSAAGVDFSSRPWAARAGIHLVYLGACLAATLAAKHVLAMP